MFEIKNKTFKSSLVFQMTQFNWFGFILVISAAATGGLRWTLSQMLTQKQELGLGNPMDFLFHLQPAMVFGMLPLLCGAYQMSFLDQFLTFFNALDLRNYIGLSSLCSLINQELLQLILNVNLKNDV